MRAQPAQDVALHAEVVRGNLQALARRPPGRLREKILVLRGEVERFAGRHAFDEVRALHLRNRACFLDERTGIELAAGHHDAAHDAARAELSRQRARVDVADRDDLVFDEVVAQRALGAPVAGNGRLVADDEAGAMRRLRLAVVGGDAGVADLRTRHRDDLSRLRRIGQDFLVAGHARVEHDFAGGFAARARSDAAEPGSVFQGKDGFFVQGSYFSSEAVTLLDSPAGTFTPAVQIR